MVRPSDTSSSFPSPLMTRWNGDPRDQVPVALAAATQRNYVDFGGANDSEAAVERWLTSPTAEIATSPQHRHSYSPRKSRITSRATGTSNWNGARYSDPGVSDIVLPSFPTTRTATFTTATTTTRGKRLLRERLKMKQRKEQQELRQQQQQQQHQHAKGGLHQASASASSHYAYEREEEDDGDVDYEDQHQHHGGNLTPSTMASTRSPNSLSFQHLGSISISSSSLSEHPSSHESAVEVTHTSATTLSSARPLRRSTSWNEGRRGRRSIERSTMDYGPRSPHHPASPTTQSPTSRSNLPSTLPRGPNALQNNDPVPPTKSGRASLPSTLPRGPAVDTTSPRSIKSSLTDPSMNAYQRTVSMPPPPPPPPAPAPMEDLSSSSRRVSVRSAPSRLCTNPRSASAAGNTRSSAPSNSKHRNKAEMVAASQPKSLLLRRFSPSVPAPQHPESDEEREKSDGKSRAFVDQQRQTTIGRTNRIRLHVYDLIAEETIMQLPWGCHFPIGQCFNAVNSGLHTLGTGAYHVGIEINGIEYAFGANETNGLTGVFTCMPMSSPGYQYRTTIDLGDRALVRTVAPSRRRGDDGQQQERYVDGREVVREMAVEYMGLDYDLLRKNCVTFAHDACLRLGVHEDHIPDWFRNLCVVGAAAQDAAHSTMAPLSRVFSSCDMDGLTDIMVETTAGFEVIGGGGPEETIVDTEGAFATATYR